MAWAPDRASAQRTEAVIAGEGALGLPVSASYAANGPGVAMRIGARIGLPGAQETFELGFNYAAFAAGETKGSSDGISLYRGFGGIRLGLDGIVKPGLFAHIGAGHVSGKIGATNGMGVRVVESLTHAAFTWDGGAYIDLAISSFFELGIQGSYNQIFKTGTARSFQWLAVGGHLQIVL